MTLLTGFLGSGKTTLLNHVLTAGTGLRIGVILNEFGEINIDSRLITRRDEDIVELTNGCVCCVMRDDVLRSIATLLERPRPPEHIVIETTGLADPVPVAQQLLDPRAQAHIRLDAIVTLVDAANFDRNLDAAEQAYAQITAGDILLINKTDLVEADVLDKIEAGLRGLNRTARVIPCVRGTVAPVLLMGVDMPHEGLTARNGDGHSHAADFSTVALRARGTVALATLSRLLDDLPPEVLRGKGILWVAGAPCKVIVHVVGARWTMAAGDPWDSEEARATELVFITKDLPEASRGHLCSRLEACLEGSPR